MSGKPLSAPAPAENANDIPKAFAASRRAYSLYLLGGRSFAAASFIRSANDHLRSLLTMADLPHFLHLDRLQLLQHLEAWTQAWDETRSRFSPTPQDLFIFPTSIPFPRDSEIRILSFLSPRCHEHNP